MTQQAAGTARTAPPATTRRRRNRRGSGEDLRAEIVVAAKSLLAEHGDVAAVSIRAVADAVGVTPPSIYLHFADKDALIDAVVADVFAKLDDALLAVEDPAAEPMQQLCAFGMAYIRFAVEHPEHYRVATMDRGSSDPNASDLVIAESAFTRMIATVEGCMRAGIFADGDPLPIALELWTSAHGVAALMIAKPYLPWGDRESFAYGALRSVALGHALNDLLGGDLDPTRASAWFAQQRAARQSPARQHASHEQEAQ